MRQWLESLGLDRYADVFAENDVDREVLPDLSEEDLAKLGVSLGHRKKLLKAASEFRASLQSAQELSTNIRPERRHLTVVFCDLVGSTALSAQLDPEDLREILREFQSCCSEAIRRYEGHIARFSGDGVLAYFGFPTAHEDDAERAVKSALQMVESVSALATRVAQKLEVRVGIATGLVVVGDLIGDGSAREFALVGEAPNLAARLQALASPNQILVAPSTRRLLGGLFELADLGDHRIKGLDQQVRVWRVVRPGAVASRFEARQSAHLTPLVGRDAEISLLHEQFLRAKRSHGGLIVISGEPGIGKSRLTMALRQRLSDEPYCLISFQCSSYHTSSAWYPIVHYLERAAGITADMTPALKLDRLEKLVSELTQDIGEIVSLLATLLSIPTGTRYPPLNLTPQQQKKWTFDAILKLLEAQTRRHPVLLIFEDVHWIDPTSLELLERIRDQARNWRILALVLIRPEFSLRWAEQPHVTTMAINRLDPTNVASIVEALAVEALLPRTIVDQIVAKADGVPLFVEEITKAVVEAADRKSNEARQLLDFQSTLTVPDTLHESLMARLDLAAPMKTVAQIAAVIGREFSLELLNEVAAMPELELRAAVDRLLESGLLLRSGEPQRQTLTFKHVLVQDEAYASLLRDERRALHIKTAEALRDEQAGARRAAPEVIAHHYTQAGQTKPAIDHWVIAGRQAAERFAFVEASTHLQSALKLLPDLPESPQRDELELQLQHLFGTILIVVKGFSAPDTGQAFKRALELCHRFEGSPQTIMVLNGIIGFQVTRDEFEQCRKLGEELLQRAEERDTVQRLIGHRALGLSLFLVGEPIAARQQLGKVLALYDAVAHDPPALMPHDIRATTQAFLALDSIVLGDINGGLSYARDAVAQAEQLRHPHSLCYVGTFLAGAYVLCSMPEAVVPISERTIAVSHEHGFALWLAGGQMLHGWARVELGDTDSGLTQLRRSITALEATGAAIWVHFGRYLLAQALTKTNHREEARGLVDQTLSAVERTSGRWYEAELYRLRGDLLLNGRAAPAAAEECYEKAISIAGRQGARFWELRATNALMESWIACGKSAEARKRLAELYTTFDTDVVTPDLMRAKTLLAATQ